MSGFGAGPETEMGHPSNAMRDMRAEEAVREGSDMVTSELLEIRGALGSLRRALLGEWAEPNSVATGTLPPVRHGGLLGHVLGQQREQGLALGECRQHLEVLIQEFMDPRELG